MSARQVVKMAQPTQNNLKYTKINFQQTEPNKSWKQIGNCQVYCGENYGNYEISNDIQQFQFEIYH